MESFPEGRFFAISTLFSLHIATVLLCEDDLRNGSRDAWDAEAKTMKLIRRTLVGIVAMTVLAACGDNDKVKGGGGAGGEGGEGGATTSSGGSSGSGGESAGGTSATTIAENPCPAPETAFGDLDTAKLFETPSVPTFDFYLPASAWENLKAHAQEEEYVEAQACFDGKAVGKVGLRFKGSYGSLFTCFDSSGKNTCRKLGMKVKFDEFDKEVKFYGVKRLNFQGYRYDNSYLKERLAYDLYRQMDIVAPRSSWAVLRVNGEEQGLFGMVEQIDGRFTSSRWPSNGEGNLFKEVWPGQTDDTWISEHLETNEKENDIAAMKDFSTALNGASVADLRATLGSYFDLSYFARYMAVDDAIGNFDGITTFYTGGTAEESGNHNFYLYQESPKRFTLVPWDLESTMSLVSQFGNVPEWQRTPTDCSIVYSVWNGQGQVMAPGCNRVFQALSAESHGLPRSRTKAARRPPHCRARI
ncbi:MAG: CotH kinase family protein [Polyangiaceae bacterium]